METVLKAGRYQLLTELGRGAMGVVYRALDPVIGRNVAVKTMRLSAEGTGMSRDELVNRFQTEARAAGLLTHPNIVVVYDAGEEEGLFYITMELVEGRSLQSLLDSGQSFPLPRVLRLMEQACSALEFAHQRMVVHRDIKPANLMLTSDDTLKITDFGTAKILQFGTTQTAHVLGTPSYMSPEQVKGKLVDGRSDIFSLGVVLYELVTGEKPFPGQNITTVIYKIVNEEPIPPRELDSSVHPGLSYVITKALAKSPDARYQTCRELWEALRNHRNLGVEAEATVAMAPHAHGADAAATQRMPGFERASDSGRLNPAAIHAADVGVGTERANRRGTFLLAIVLLAIIFGAGYRVWPYVRDVWHASRAELERRSLVATPQASPAGTSAHPEAEPQTGQTALPPNTEQPVKPAPVAAPPKEEKHAPRSETVKPDAEPPPTSPMAQLTSRIQQGLARAGLADKVQLHVADNSITLSGRLTPREHRVLLAGLRRAPAWARIVDHIEYADPGTQGDRLLRQESSSGRGSIELFTDVLGAQAILHGPYGGKISECTSPCSFRNLWPGRYTLSVSQPGAAPVERVIDVPADSVVTQRIHVEKAGPGLFVTTAPSGASVFVNGQRQASLTPATLALEPGDYRIEFQKPGFAPYTENVHVQPGEPTHLDIDLASLSAGAGNGWVFVRTLPRGAEILVDGMPTRQRSPAQLVLSAGEHTITLNLKGFPSVERSVSVLEGRVVSVNAALR